jgi:hypothetical protein
MFIAKVKSKEYQNGVLRITVTFTDGVTSVDEWCIAQDEDGFKFWVKSRLATFNSGPAIESKYLDGEVVVIDDSVEPHVPTPEEIARDTWLKNYRKWIEVKTKLVDTGILTGSETKVTQLKAKVQSDFLPAYLDFI